MKRRETWPCDIGITLSDIVIRSPHAQTCFCFTYATDITPATAMPSKMKYFYLNPRSKVCLRTPKIKIFSNNPNSVVSYF